MTTASDEILICRDPTGTHWGLGEPSNVTGGLTLIGWRVSPPAVDAGVPGEVANVLARALVSAARVVFPYSGVKEAVPNSWTPLDDGDLIRALKDDSLDARLRGALRDVASESVLLATRDPRRVLQLFDDPAHPWWMQGHVALLTDPELPPPEIDRRSLFALFEEGWTQRASALRDAGIGAVLRPGVDGDVAGLLALDGKLGDALLAALQSESRAAGFEWATLSEDEFAERLAAVGGV